MVWFEPFEEIERLHKRIHELMRRVWEPFRELRLEIPEIAYFPVDIAETPEEIVVRADLPGFEKEDVRLRVSERTLEIEAGRKEVKKEVTETMIRAERRVGALRRSIALPTEVDPETAKASMERGVLEVRVKKVKPARKVKEVKIE
jgi:HSP20 family protein